MNLNSVQFFAANNNPRTFFRAEPESAGKYSVQQLCKPGRNVPLLPRNVKILPAHVTVSGKLGIYRTAEIEPVDKRGGTQINKSADLIGDNILVNLCRSEGIDPDRDRLGNTDGIRDLNLAPVGKPGGNDVLCYVPRGILSSAR